MLNTDKNELRNLISQITLFIEKEKGGLHEIINKISYFIDQKEHELLNKKVLDVFLDLEIIYALSLDGKLNLKEEKTELNKQLYKICNEISGYII